MLLVSQQLRGGPSTFVHWKIVLWHLNLPAFVPLKSTSVDDQLGGP